MSATKTPATTEQPKARPRGLDPELQTMARIDRLLAGLKPAEARRVLQWIVDRWAVEGIEPERFSPMEITG